MWWLIRICVSCFVHSKRSAMRLKSESKLFSEVRGDQVVSQPQALEAGRTMPPQTTPTTGFGDPYANRSGLTHPFMPGGYPQNPAYPSNDGFNSYLTYPTYSGMPGYAPANPYPPSTYQQPQASQQCVCCALNAEYGKSAEFP